MNEILIPRCLGVIIPSYNEASTIEEILRRVLAQPDVGEVIIVDDGSDDGTQELLKAGAEEDERVRVFFHNQNRGKGAAIRTGMAASISPVLVIQDADLEYDPKDYIPMLRLIVEDKADVVYGSRFFGDYNPENPGWHTLGNRLLTWCSNFATGLNLTDEATCYKMFRRNLLTGVELKEDGFGFCPEITAIFSKLGVRIREVPISYCGRTKAEGKKIRLRDGVNALACIASYNICPLRSRARPEHTEPTISKIK